jgi:hypothetical protein
MTKKQAPAPPYTFFVKTEEAVHQGGFVFFGVEEFEAAQPLLKKEAAHICGSNSHTLKSWGVVDSSGQVFKEFTPDGD